MNPYSTMNSLNQMAGGLVYEQLVQLDDTFQPMPGLFLSWTTEDGTVWTFQPDTSRLFHDGHALTAEDAVYSINTARESELYTARLRNITDVAVSEEGAVVVTLNRANTQFPVLLTIPVIENNAMSYTYPSGTGPYRYEGDGTTLVAFGTIRTRRICRSTRSICANTARWRTSSTPSTTAISTSSATTPPARAI